MFSKLAIVDFDGPLVEINYHDIGMERIEEDPVKYLFDNKGLFIGKEEREILEKILPKMQINKDTFTYLSNLKEKGYYIVVVTNNPLADYLVEYIGNNYQKYKGVIDRTENAISFIKNNNGKIMGIENGYKKSEIAEMYLSTLKPKKIEIITDLMNGEEHKVIEVCKNYAQGFSSKMKVKVV